ncbi:hypothetical protein D3C79_774890 [compost metagenome]
MFHAQPHALDVDAHDRVELRFAAFGQTALLDFDTGVVEGIVQPPIGLDSACQQLLHVGLTGDITSDEQCLTACRADQFDRGFAADSVEVCHHHLQTFSRKGQRRRPANTCCAPGDQGNLARKTHAHR